MRVNHQWGGGGSAGWLGEVGYVMGRRALSSGAGEGHEFTNSV